MLTRSTHCKITKLRIQKFIINILLKSIKMFEYFRKYTRVINLEKNWISIILIFFFYQNIYHIRYSENEIKSDGISQIFFLFKSTVHVTEIRKIKNSNFNYFYCTLILIDIFKMIDFRKYLFANIYSLWFETNIKMIIYIFYTN